MVVEQKAVTHQSRQDGRQVQVDWWGEARATY